MRYHRILTRGLSLSFAFALALLPAALMAQRTTGVINGTVTDPEARVIEGVAVTLTNRDTNIVSRTTTNGSGAFVFLNIDPGPYVLKFEKQGFRTISVPSFNLTVNQTLTENEMMSVGATTETVEVSADHVGVLLQKSNSELGTVIQAQEIQQLPLNGRNFTSLLVLSPGVTPVSTAQGSGISTTDAGITAIPGTQFYKVSFFGQQNRETLYLMDGIVNTDLRRHLWVPADHRCDERVQGAVSYRQRRIWRGNRRHCEPVI